MKKLALLSVSDKTSIVEFAQELQQLGFLILSTGGTFQLLKDNDIHAIEVSAHTGFSEMMDGRVKTLHPKIHGGILGRRGIDDEVMHANGIDAIDIVCVNLYPFAQTIAQPNVAMTTAIENIDIGGPAMVRSAAKNHAHVGIITNPEDYPRIIHELKQTGRLTDATRFDLAVKAFEHTAQYDGMIANFLGARLLQADESLNDDATAKTQFPRTFNSQFIKSQALRYGENPHQAAAFYTESQVHEASISNAKQLQGKALSYNNIADTDSALECVKCFDGPACVIVKHANPCGVALSTNGILEAYQRAYATDPESAFGGIIAFNRPLDVACAQAIIERQFVEVIIAPSVADGVLDVINHKKNIRLLVCGKLPDSTKRASQFDFKRVNGGLLVQEQDLGMISKDDLQVVSQKVPTDSELDDLIFAWKVAKYVKSNAIVYAKNHQTIGIGAGQMSRVNSARIAISKAEHAGLMVKGAVMASDAFFPFRDGIDNAAKAGIQCIIQPGGSMRDDEVIAATNEHGMAMVFTGMRHFRH